MSGVMPTVPERRRPEPPVRRRATVRYALAWVAGGVLAALAIIGLIRTIGGPDPTVPLRPVNQPSLDAAVRTAGCRVSDLAAAPRPAGRARLSAEPGLYDEPIGQDAVAAAAREGLVVIEYRPPADEDTVRELFDAVPEGTVVAPRDDLADAVAATAWRRQLRCPRLDTAALDALQLFRGRFLGRAPDS